MEKDVNYIVSSQDLEYIKAHNKWKLTWVDYLSDLLSGIPYLFALFFITLADLYYLLLLVVPITLRFIRGCYQDVKFGSIVTPMSKEDNHKLVVDFLQHQKKIRFKQFSEYIVGDPVLPFYRIKTQIIVIPLDKKILIGCTLSSKYKGFSADHISLRNFKKEIAIKLLLPKLE